MSSTIQRTTACNRDCPDACSLIATIEGERIVRLQGDPEHPITQGFLCHRTSRFLERQYHPDRLTTPLIRRGESLQPFGWDEALDMIAEKLLQVRNESGGAAVMHYRCGGSMGMMKLVTDYFFEKFGPVTIKSGDICTGAGDAAQTADFGANDSHDLFDLLNSKTIVLWGKNVFCSNVHMIPLLKKARAAGARIVLIDPVHHQTTTICDRYLQPRPGGDIAIAMGIVRWLIDHDRIDSESAEYCDNWEQFVGGARQYDVGQWAGQADVPQAALEELAEWYSDRPAAILMGWGMQRRAQGCSIIRSINGLAAVSGNLGIPGGGSSFYYSRRSAFDLDFLQGAAVAPRMIPEPMLGPGIMEATDPPVRLLWVTAANPVAMLPQSETVAEALRSREMTVVVDSFLTDSAQQAHIVLPTTTMLEEDDLLGSYGHHWLAEMRSVVAPPPEVRTDYEIVQALASRLSLGEEFSLSVDQWKRRMLGRVERHGVTLESFREGAVKNPLVDSIMFPERRFPTPTGRVNLMPEIASDPPAADPARPLLLMAISTKDAQGSQWVEGSQEGPAVATLHPDAAGDFSEGETVAVESEHGRMQVQLRFDEQQRSDILLVPKGGWMDQGRCANMLIAASMSDGGECAAYYDTAVRLVKE